MLDPSETAAIEQMCKLYGLEQTRKPKRNQRAVWTGRYDDHDIRVASYGSFVSVNVAFGGAMHTSGIPMGERGIAEATSDVATPLTIAAARASRIGTGIPGWTIPGLRWRVTGMAPRSRTVIVHQYYHPCDDIVEHLLSLEDDCAALAGSKRDLTYGMVTDQGWQ